MLRLRIRRAWPGSQIPVPRQAAMGRLGQVCDRWICTACLCFALDTGEQGISGFGYGYWVYQRPAAGRW